MDGAALTDRFERIGASVDAHADWDAATVTLTALPSVCPRRCARARSASRARRSPSAKSTRLKDERLAELLQLRAEPRASPTNSSRGPYMHRRRDTRTRGGDARRACDALTRDVVRAVLRSSAIARSTTTLVFAGDVTVEGARTLAEQLFGDWHGRRRPATTERSIDAAPARKLVRVVAKSDAPQSELRVGIVGIPRNHPDYLRRT